MMHRWLFALFFAGAVSVTSSVRADTAASAVDGVEDRWAHIRYDLKDNREKLEAAQTLASTTKSLTQQYPATADVLIWHALVLLLEAEVRHDLSALGMAKEAKDLLEKADGIDTNALNGTIHTTLGALYDEVPGWPVGFGDNRKATEHFNKALAIDPAGMDANYFYGDYLLLHGKAREAVTYLEKALAAPVRPGHEHADIGRRTEIAESLSQAQKKLKK